MKFVSLAHKLLTKNILITSLSILWTVGTTGTAQSQNLLVNGGFENPSLASGRFQNFGSGTSFSGWRVESFASAIGGVEVFNPTSPFNNPTIDSFNWQTSDIPQGTQVLDLNGAFLPNPTTGAAGAGGSIVQTISTVVGQTYDFSFFFANNPLPNVNPFTQPESALALITDGNSGDTILSQSVTHTDSTLTNPGFDFFTTQFVATSNLTTIRFATTSNFGEPSGGIIIDAVSVTVVPEPSTLYLALLVPVLSLLHRKRR